MLVRVRQVVSHYHEINYSRIMKKILFNSARFVIFLTLWAIWALCVVFVISLVEHTTVEMACTFPSAALLAFALGWIPPMCIIVDWEEKEERIREVVVQDQREHPNLLHVRWMNQNFLVEFVGNRFICMPITTEFALYSTIRFLDYRGNGDVKFDELVMKYKDEVEHKIVN